MTRAKDISKIVTDADLSGTLDVAGELQVGVDGTTAGLIRLMDSGSVTEEATISTDANGGLIFGGNSGPGELIFKTSSGTERVRITSSGNVGIGTSSPDLKLDVSHGTSNEYVATFQNTADNLELKIGTTSGLLNIQGANASNNTAYQIALNAEGGNVGIGISNPDDKLHVADSSNAELKLQTDNANGGSVVKFNRSGTDNSYIGTKGYFLGNSDNNLYLRANSGLGIQFYTNGNNERMRIDSSGNVGIGTSSPTELLEVHGDTPTIKLRDTSAYSAYTGPVIAFQGRDNNESFTNFAQVSGLSVSSNNGLLKFETRLSGSLNEAMRIDQSGNLMVGRTNNPSGVSNCIYALGNYGVTTSSGANVFINSEGLFFRSTSSQRYKNTINDATHGLTELLTLRPVTYKGNNDGDTVFGGLIAEEVHDSGLTEFVQYNDDGEPDALAYGHMVSLCIKAIQELKAELDSAKARITTLENGE